MYAADLAITDGQTDRRTDRHRPNEYCNFSSAYMPRVH